MLRHLAILTLAATTLAATVAEMHDPAPPDASATGTVTLSCGGYDQSGEVVNEQAAEIGTFVVDEASSLDVPDVCGGYRADGTFIGDD